MSASGLAELLGTFDPIVVERGRRYVAEGRVTGVRHEREIVRATVLGTNRYDVVLVDSEGNVATTCTCPAHGREGQCKHVAALAVSLQRGDRDGRDALPEVLRQVYSSSIFLDRLSLHAGVMLGDRRERWSTLFDWWRTVGPRHEIRARILTHAPEIARDLETLRTWTPPDPPRPGTVFGDLYAHLAKRYVDSRADVAVRSSPPGPLDARHPGFEFSYEPRRGVFQAHERPSPLVHTQRRLAFTLMPPSRAQAEFLDGAFTTYGPTDAWPLFALREVLLAMQARAHWAVRELEDELARPTWDHVLEQLARETSKAPESREWAFSLAPTYYRQIYELVAFARKPGKKWKRASFEAAFDEELPELEREIARVGLTFVERRSQPRFELGTPQAHELLRLLAGHPRVTLAPPQEKPDPDRDPAAEIFAGDLAMRLERAPNGILAPKFLVGGKDLTAAITVESPSGRVAAVSRGNMIASAFVPASLRPWLAAATRMGSALAFPPESVGKLAETTESLVAQGVVDLPRDALGA
ncbi:MAG TPA: SWIM zinc finger family protein, partial [Labilithrix sp.]